MTRLQILFERYLTDSCKPEEKAELFELLNQPDNIEAKRLLNEIWNEPAVKLSPGKSQHILDSIMRPEAKVIPIERKKFQWLKAAAVTAFLALAGGAAYQIVDSGDTTSEEKVAVVGQQPKFIKLPDGSKVVLNKESKLEYPDSFDGKSAREVYLTGEAFFDISHDASKSFIVHTGKISTTVLGTAFNVKAYPEQNDITVTVTRGKVKVSDEAKVLGILSPDDQITFNRYDQKSKTLSVKTEEVTAWTEKDIFLDNVSMVEAAEELSQRFDVSIGFENENLNACRFTATFTRGEDLHQILNVICEFNQAKYTVTETGDIEVSGDGCLGEK
jgi:transmembrane sensor